LIHVVLDTNVFSGDRKRQYGPFRALTRLCKAKKVQLHVPYYVKYEFITQQAQEVRKNLRAIRKAADAIGTVSAENRIGKFAEDLSKEATTLRKDAPNLVEQEFEAWLTEIRPEQYQVDPSYAVRVTTDYFKGNPPFKAVKNRNDIPDSFVWQTVLDLKKKYKPLHVVATDGGMFKAADEMDGIVAHKDLAKFIDTEECQKLLRALPNEVVVKNIQRAAAMIEGVKDKLESGLSSEIFGALDGKTVFDDDIPDDNNEGMIHMQNEPEDVEFDFEKVDYYGDTDIGIPFEATVECTLNYAIFKGDYFSLPQEKMDKISISERNEHYFDADEEYPIKVTGTMLIQLPVDRLKDPKIDDGDLQDLFDEADYTLEVDEIEVA